MLYKTFPRIGVRSSALGFGCMRLPTAEGKIREAEAIAMIRHAIDSGITYVDTAYPYHGGESERVVGKALRDGYRERVTLATKLPTWAVEKHEDMMAILDEQLAKLQTDHVDFYLLHAMNAERTEKMRRLDYQSFLKEALDSGKIRYPAFSFHDNFDAFVELLNDYDWKLCQVQMNILDGDRQATLEGIRLAGEKGVGVVIMEPLRGGLMANPPASVEALYEGFEPRRSAVEWAFRYLYTMPQVITILSGMSTMEQVKDNLRIFNAAREEPLTDAEKQLYADVKEAYLSLVKTRCTGCRYCQPCPRGVAIPRIFQGMDGGLLSGSLDRFRKEYQELVTGAQDASRCVACGKCEAACPQHLPVIRFLQEIRQEIGS